MLDLVSILGSERVPAITKCNGLSQAESNPIAQYRSIYRY